MPSEGYAAGSLIVLWSVETCVRWGEAGSEQCWIDYVLPKSMGKTGAAYLLVEGHCIGGMPDVSADGIRPNAPLATHNAN